MCQRPGVVVKNAKKTGETERKLDNASKKANEKLQAYVETNKVNKAHSELAVPPSVQHSGRLM